MLLLLISIGKLLILISVSTNDGFVMIFGVIDIFDGNIVCTYSGNSCKAKEIY